MVAHQKRLRSCTLLLRHKASRILVGTHLDRTAKNKQDDNYRDLGKAREAIHWTGLDWTDKKSFERPFLYCLCQFDKGYLITSFRDNFFSLGLYVSSKKVPLTKRFFMDVLNL